MPYWKLYYHFIWGTKQRLPLINGTIEPKLYRAIAAKAQAMEGFVHAIGGVEDHVHMAVSIPPKVAPAKFIGDVKGNSSHFVNHIMKPSFDFYWQDEYGVVSFGEKSLPRWYDIFRIKNNITLTERCSLQWRKLTTPQPPWDKPHGYAHQAG